MSRRWMVGRVLGGVDAVPGGGASDEVRTPSCSLDRPDLVEPRFGVLGCEVAGGLRHCTADPRRWRVGGTGTEQPGAIAVLLDHVLGEVGNHPQPSGFLPLTTHLSIDVLRPPPWGDGLLHASALRVREDFRASFSRAEVTDPAGTLIAAAGAWTTYVPSQGAPPLATGGAAVSPAAPPKARGVADLLGLTVTAEGTTSGAASLHATDWCNQYGSLHGGVWACGAEIVASRLLSGGEHALRPTHLEVAFLRAGRTADVEFVARVVRRGRTLGLVEVDGLDADGKLCVRASVTGQC